MADWDIFCNEGESMLVPPDKSSGTYDSSQVRVALGYPNDTRCLFPSAETRVYAHLRFSTNNTSSSSYGPLIRLWDASLNELARLEVAPNLSAIRLMGRVGGVLTSGSAYGGVSMESTNTPYVKLMLDTVTGELKAYVDSVEVLSLAVDAPATPISSGGVYNSPVSAYFSVLAFTTRNRNLSNYYTKQPTGDGTDVDGTGSYLDIDEAYLSTADSCTFSAVGQRRSVLSANRTISNTILGFTVACYAAKEDLTGPQSITPYVKIGGTRYYGAAQALTTALAGYYHNFLLNPATGTAWTSAVINDVAFEYGWEASA